MSAGQLGGETGLLERCTLTCGGAAAAGAVAAASGTSVATATTPAAPLARRDGQPPDARPDIRW